MSFLSDLFAPSNLKHYRKLARASGEVRHHTGVKLSIEINLLLSQHQALSSGHKKVYEAENYDLAGRMMDELHANDQFFGNFERSRASSLAEHKNLMNAAVDVKGLATLSDYEIDLNNMFKIALEQTAERLAKTSAAHVEGLTFLRDIGALNAMSK